MSTNTESGTETRVRSGLIAAAFLRKLLGCIETGHLTVHTPDGLTVDHRSGQSGPQAVLVLHRWRALRRLLVGGHVAFAEAYIDGDWSSPDLPALLELAALNVAGIQHRISGLPPMRLFNRLHHILRANSRRGSRRNIAYHYDMGNDFYRLWLDGSMTYSSALFLRPDETLEQAQDNKLDRILDLLSPRQRDKVLEIGCGWGALATRLAKNGADVKGITLSSEQLAHARQVAASGKVDDRIHIELEDYRDCTGSYDRIVSIEMLEAVGQEYWAVYFDRLRQLLKAEGRAVLQVITIDEKRFEAYGRGADFIQRYIFPGGMLPTKSLIEDHARQASLRLVSSESFGRSYARTLAEWRQRFQHNWPAIKALGFDERFRRLWNYYLSYCEAGFTAGTIDVGLYVLEPKVDFSK